MSKQIVLRIMSKAGRSRIELNDTDTLGKLKQELEERLITNDEFQIFLDDKLTKKLVGKNTDSLIALKLKNGDMLHIGNQDVKLRSSQPSGMPNVAEESKKKEWSASGDDSMQIDTSSKQTVQGGSPTLGKQKSKVLSEEAVKKSHCTHGPNGKCINCLGVTKDSMKEVKFSCNHPPGQRCVNCTQTQDTLANVKHESFEHYLLEIKNKCKKQHKPDQKCQNCIPFSQYSYKVNYNCPNHRPFPEGMCNKCIPPTVILKRQTYRHADYLAFMNFTEMASFVGNWQQSGCMEQRMGFLYGYYSEDPNYPEGVRVNIEAVYEPPQIGEMGGVEPLEDPLQNKVDMIAAALQLEKVGWIFTSLNQEVCLTAQEIRKVARLQEMYKVDHPEGYKVSKFVTVVVKPRGDGAETGLDCFMVSDQCQALERDNIFGESEQKKKMILRKCGPNEMIPACMTEGKTVTEFDPDFFIVQLVHGQPKTIKDYNILKNHDFPAYNRGKTPKKDDYKKYISRHKNEPSQRKFACFQLLIYIAELMDIDTALTIAESVADEKPLEPYLVELLDSQGS